MINKINPNTKKKFNFENFILLLFIGATLTYLLFFNEEANIRGTWSCYKNGNNIFLIFKKDNSFELSSDGINGSLEIKGKYEDSIYNMNKDDKKEDFNYKKVKLKYNSYVINGNYVKPTKNINIVFGVKEKEGHLILNSSDFEGYYCVKK